MRKINLDFVLPLFIYFWTAYTCYTIIITIYDFSHMKHLSWMSAENQTGVYSSRRSTTVTYNFIKDDIRISRKYPGIVEGFNTWVWGIDKKNDKVNISFYLREKDYNRVKNKEIKHRKDIFGGKLKEIEPIPFFGLREIGSNSSNFLLWTDIWKFNYKWWIFLVFLLIPGLLVFLIKKMGIVKDIESKKKSNLTKINDYIFWTLSIINIINLFI